MDTPPLKWSRSPPPPFLWLYCFCLLACMLQYIEDPRYGHIHQKICTTIREDMAYQKGPWNKVIQVCFGIKVGCMGIGNRLHLALGYNQCAHVTSIHLFSTVRNQWTARHCQKDLQRGLRWHLWFVPPVCSATFFTAANCTKQGKCQCALRRGITCDGLMSSLQIDDALM